MKRAFLLIKYPRKGICAKKRAYSFAVNKLPSIFKHLINPLPHETFLGAALTIVYCIRTKRN